MHDLNVNPASTLSLDLSLFDNLDDILVLKRMPLAHFHRVILDACPPHPRILEIINERPVDLSAEPFHGGHLGALGVRVGSKGGG